MKLKFNRFLCKNNSGKYIKYLISVKKLFFQVIKELVQIIYSRLKFKQYFFYEFLHPSN